MNDPIDETQNHQHSDANDTGEGQLADAASFDNVTPIKPDHSNARANLYIEGLSVLGFNPDEERAEVAFFKHMHNPVEMKIFNGDCELIWSSENDVPSSTTITEINVNKTKTGIGFRYEDAADDESFEKMPDLAKWHNVKKLESTPDPGNTHLSARLHVYDAVFYTHKMSVNNATRYEQGLTNPMPLGRIGRIPGCDIFCPPSENLEIEIKLKNGSSISKSFKKENKPYQIIVRSQPTDPTDNRSHLAHLYHILKRPPGDQRTFALRFDAPEPFFELCNESRTMSAEEQKKLLATQFECQTFGGGCCW